MASNQNFDLLRFHPVRGRPRSARTSRQSAMASLIFFNACGLVLPSDSRNREWTDIRQSKLRPRRDQGSLKVSYSTCNRCWNRFSSAGHSTQPTALSYQPQYGLMNKRVFISKIQRQAQTINQLSRNTGAAQPAHLTALFEKFIFRQRVNEVATNGSFPIQTIGFIQNGFVTFQVTIQSHRSAKQGR